MGISSLCSLDFLAEAFSLNQNFNTCKTTDMGNGSYSYFLIGEQEFSKKNNTD